MSTSDPVLIEKMSVSPTGLSYFMRSPQHFLHYKTKEFETTGPMQEGKALHLMLLEPEKVEKQIYTSKTNAVPPGYILVSTIDDIRSYLNSQNDSNLKAVISKLKPTKKDQWVQILKKYRQYKKDSKALLPEDLEEYNKKHDRIQLTDSTLYRLHQQLKNIKDHPKIQYLESFREKIWREEDYSTELYGLHIHGRVDMLVETPDEMIVADLKQMKSANPSDLSKEVFFKDLYMKAAFYIHCVKANFPGVKKKYSFYIIASESTEPYLSMVYRISDDAVALGEKVFLKNVRDLKKCHDERNWPGYSTEELITVDMLPWQYQNIQLKLNPEASKY